MESNYKGIRRRESAEKAELPVARDFDMILGKFLPRESQSADRSVINDWRIVKGVIAIGQPCNRIEVLGPARRCDARLLDKIGFRHVQRIPCTGSKTSFGLSAVTGNIVSNGGC